MGVQYVQKDKQWNALVAVGSEGGNLSIHSAYYLLLVFAGLQAW